MIKPYFFSFGNSKLPCIYGHEDEFLFSINRAEMKENPRVYMKAIRATLVALGYNEDYINGEFRDIMEDLYEKI